MSKKTPYKINAVASGNGLGMFAAFDKYRILNYGNISLWKAILAEMTFCLFGGAPGAFGLMVRSKIYPKFFRSTGKKVFFGKNVTIRHPHKITLGDRVIIDDNCVIDAKGEDNEGITIDDDVYIGRNSIIYCKNGDIKIGKATNISSNCQIFSSNEMTIGDGTVIGAYSYLLSGGAYDFSAGAARFTEQDGFITKGPLTIGDNCWLGARVTIIDAASVETGCVIAAGAVVTKPLPANVVAGGVPARIIKPTGNAAVR